MIKSLFIILFLIIPTVSLYNGMALSNTHLIFYLVALMLFLFNENNFSILIKQIKNIKTLKLGNLIQFEQIEEFKEISKNIKVEENGNSLHISISEKYSNELLISKLNYNYSLINSHIKCIYNLLYNDYSPNMDVILVFDYLRTKEILDNNFCTYVYNVCSYIADYIKNPTSKEIASDLITISTDIISKLIYVEKYIKDNILSKNEELISHEHI